MGGGELGERRRRAPGPCWTVQMEARLPIVLYLPSSSAVTLKSFPWALHREDSKQPASPLSPSCLSLPATFILLLLSESRWQQCASLARAQESVNPEGTKALALCLIHVWLRAESYTTMKSSCIDLPAPELSRGIQPSLAASPLYLRCLILCLYLGLT